MSLYEILGVDYDVTEEMLKEAHRIKIEEYHLCDKKIQEINQAYNMLMYKIFIGQCKQDKISKYKSFVRDFFEKKGINASSEEYINNYLDYEISFSELKEQLEKYFEKRNLEYKNNLPKIINKIIEGFKLYPNYDKLTSKVDFIRTSYLKKINQIQSEILIEDLLKKMNQELENLFTLYYENSRKINELEKESLDEEEKSVLEKIKLDIMNLDFEENYQSLYKKVLERKRHKYWENNINDINILYKDILLRVYNYLSTISFDGDENKIYYLHELEISVRDLFKKAKTACIDPANLYRLKHLTFDDPVKDISIIQAIDHGLPYNEASNLYLKQYDNNYYLSWLSFFQGSYYMNYVIKTNNDEFKYKNDRVSLEEIQNNYYLLDTNAFYLINEKITYIDEEISLTINENCEICITEKNIHCVVEDEDKNYIISLLKEQIYSFLGSKLDTDDSLKL